MKQRHNDDWHSRYLHLCHKKQNFTIFRHFPKKPISNSVNLGEVYINLDEVYIDLAEI